MKLVIHPVIDQPRLEQIIHAAGPMQVVNADSEATARDAIVDADAFFGKLTPEMLAASTRLRWVQSPTASLEHYLFPELIAHPLVLTNMRGLYSDVIAEHVLGMMLCFTRNLHTYVRHQMAGCWDPVGGEQQRVTFAAGPGVTNAIDRRIPTWAISPRASSAWDKSAPKSPGGWQVLGCASWPSIRSSNRRPRG